MKLMTNRGKLASFDHFGAHAILSWTGTTRVNQSYKIIEPININRYQFFLKCPLSANDKSIFGWAKP